MDEAREDEVRLILEQIVVSSLKSRSWIVRMKEISSFESSKAGRREEMNHEGTNRLPLVQQLITHDGAEAKRGIAGLQR